MATKRKSLFNDEKVLLIRAIEAGKKISEVGKSFGFSRSTVATIWKNKEKILQADEDGKSSKKLKKPKYEDLDKAMLSWFHRQSQDNMPVSGTIVKAKAEEFSEQLGLTAFKASEGWLGKFKQRHHIDNGSKKKQVSLDQLVALLDFLKEHPALAKGLTRGLRGKHHTVKLWHLCAKKLNSIKGGASKDGKGWAKYWCDWKYRVRRKVLELRVIKESNTPLPEGITELTDLEKTMIDIIGDNTVANVVIKSDPLADRDSADDEPDDNENNEDLTNHQYDDTLQSTSNHQKRKHSTPEMSDIDRSRSCSPIEIKPKLCTINIEEDSDSERDTGEFLRIEKKRLKIDDQILKKLGNIEFQLTRMADIMSDFRDVYVEKGPNN